MSLLSTSPTTHPRFHFYFLFFLLVFCCKDTSKILILSAFCPDRMAVSHSKKGEGFVALFYICRISHSLMGTVWFTSSIPSK